METSFYFGKGLNIMKELICLIGPSGGGKSTVSKILSESYHYTLASTTFFVKDLKKKIQSTKNYLYDTNELIAAVSLYYKFGFNEFISERLDSLNSDKIVWDSCININDIEVISGNTISDLPTPYDVRIKRIIARGTYPQKSYTDVRKIIDKIDQYERSLGLGDLILLSDYTICVEGLDHLKESIDRFMSICIPTSVEEKIRNCNYKFPLPTAENINLLPLSEYLEETEK